MRATGPTLRLPYTCLSLDHARHVRRGWRRRLAGEALCRPETIAVFAVLADFPFCLNACHREFNRDDFFESVVDITGRRIQDPPRCFAARFPSRFHERVSGPCAGIRRHP